MPFSPQGLLPLGSESRRARRPNVHISIAQLLIQSSAEVNSVFRRGHTGIAQSLIQSGTAVDSRTKRWSDYPCDVRRSPHPGSVKPVINQSSGTTNATRSHPSKTFRRGR